LIYIDTNSLLKLFITDGQSVAVDHAISRESSVVVSPLTELESSVQLRGIYLGGSMGAARFEQTRERLAETLANHPFVKCPLARLGDRNQEWLVQGSGRRGRVCMDGLC
jgi:hypothetical protein